MDNFEPIKNGIIIFSKSLEINYMKIMSNNTQADHIVIYYSRPRDYSMKFVFIFTLKIS